MFRIDTTTRDINLFGAGKDGYTNGNPIGGIPPTQTSDAHLNAFQEELSGLVEGFGRALVKANNGQVFAALGLMLSQLSASNWTARSTGTSDALNALAYGAPVKLFVAVGASGQFASSVDGANWALQTIGGAIMRGLAADGGGGFVAVGDSGTIYSAPDGVSWSSETSGVATALLGVAWFGGLWVAVGASGVILTSPDRVTWTARTSGVATSLNAVAHDGTSTWTAVGASGVILTSPDGFTWTSRASGIVTALSGVTFSAGAGLWCAVGAAGVVLTSPDHLTWTARSSGATVALASVSVDGRGALVVVGATNTVLSSLDAITWASRQSTLPGTPGLAGVCAGAGCWLISGAGGVLATGLWT